jgi:hypothetical protein
MDYLFLWIELRFLSGKQLPLFTQQATDVGYKGGTEPNQTPFSLSQFLHDNYEVGGS